MLLPGSRQAATGRGSARLTAELAPYRRELQSKPEHWNNMLGT